MYNLSFQWLLALGLLSSLPILVDAEDAIELVPVPARLTKRHDDPSNLELMNKENL
jgi:hypothetical protein